MRLRIEGANKRFTAKNTLCPKFHGPNSRPYVHQTIVLDGCEIKAYYDPVDGRRAYLVLDGECYSFNVSLLANIGDKGRVRTL